MNTILIAGATGTQGGAVIDELLSGDYGEFELRGLTRDVESEAAMALSGRGVTLVEGDMTDADRMRELCADVDAVFCVTTFFEAGTDAEIEQGTTLAEAAAAAGVEHFVYSSVASADADTGLAHFESKLAVEAKIAELGLPATVIRPAYFMQNFAFMNGEDVRNGRLAMPLAEGVSLQVVDARDIGVAVATVLADRDRFLGETIELAGDEMTLGEFAAAFTTALDRSIEPVRLDIEAYRGAAGDEMADMFAWFNETGYDVDVDALHDEYGIHTRSLPSFLADTEAFQARPVA
jgi:uncharacterized protein YbjT (DUF2867 family)